MTGIDYQLFGPDVIGHEGEKDEIEKAEENKENCQIQKTSSDSPIGLMQTSAI